MYVTYKWPWIRKEAWAMALQQSNNTKQFRNVNFNFERYLGIRVRWIERKE